MGNSHCGSLGLFGFMEEPELARALSENLNAAGFRVTFCGSPLEAIAAMPDIVLVSPGTRMHEREALLRDLRTDPRAATIRTLVLDRSKDELSEVLAFALGADDWIVYPISDRLLLARIRAIQRRGQSRPRSPLERGSEPIVWGALRINPLERTAAVAGTDAGLTPVEFNILYEVAVRRGGVAAREHLITTVFGSTDRRDRRLDTHMASIRRKLGPNSTLIKTVRGVGYQLAESYTADAT